jgi:hypothetical protein
MRIQKRRKRFRYISDWGTGKASANGISHPHCLSIGKAAAKDLKTSMSASTLPIS